MATNQFYLPYELARHLSSMWENPDIARANVGSSSIIQNDPASWLRQLEGRVGGQQMQDWYTDWAKSGGFSERSPGSAASYNDIFGNPNLSVWQEDDDSVLEGMLEIAKPLAVMGATAYGANSLFGPAAAGAGAGAGGAELLASELAAPVSLSEMSAAFPGLAGAGAAAGALMPAAIPESASTLAEWGLSETAPGVFENIANSKAFGSLTGGLSGVASSLGLGNLASGLGDLLGGVKSLLPSGGGYDTALAMGPILAAINYAKNQGGFDTSRLESTYDQFQPEALAYEYDQNTARGRDALTSSLTSRNVMGSSFGNMDLTNFQTTRDLGRRSLVNQGLAARGGLANNILEAKIKERGLKNDLYGRSLLALGNVFGGRNQSPAYA